jgi:predicted O-methyltransferase YrrM
MRITSFHALTPRRQSAWRAIRYLIPPKPRFLFEGSMHVRGQLWYGERKLLYETVLDTKPNVAFEIGTWEGGGSTLFIAQALFESGNGVLHTVELDLERYSTARHSYETHLPHLVDTVRFHHGSSLEVMPDLLSSEGRCDLLFLDGAQDAEQTWDELEMFLEYLRPGSVVIAHDWDNDKMATVRPRIESDPRFEIVERLTAPASVGMVSTRVIEPRR